jgi:hypothetical protein
VGNGLVVFSAGYDAVAGVVTFSAGAATLDAPVAALGTVIAVASAKQFAQSYVAFARSCGFGP